MTDLVKQVKSFLEAEGYVVSSRRQLLVGSRRTLAEDTEITYVWIPENYDPASFASRESDFLSRFDKASRSNPTASKYMVVPTLEGLSRQFREGVFKWYKVNVRNPIQFFDTNFKWDTSPDFTSAAKELRDRGREEQNRRIAQPYTIEGAQGSGEDLLKTLRDDFTGRNKQGKSIKIVIGPAGIGKSFLFNALFSEIHEAFMSYKTRGGPYAPRPIPLLPEYIPIADARTVRSLLSAYLQTDFARPLKRELFEWTLYNGAAVWMLDGLDEVISQDPSFFDYLVDLVECQDTPFRPTVLICVRDSLLTAYESFGAFLSDYGDEVSLYRLAKWDTSSKRRFAEITLKDSADVFLRTLGDRPSLNDLAGTPYYCDLLAKSFKEGKLKGEYTEELLLDYALESIINRDYDKKFIYKSMIKPEEVIEFLEAAALEDFGRGFHGIPVQDAQEWARVILPAKLGEDEQERLSSQMVSLGLFAKSSPGYIQFSQEILEHYLLGRRIVTLFEDKEHEDIFIRELAQRELPGDWLTIRFVARHIRNTKQSLRLKGLITKSIAYPIAFKNVLKIALADPDRPTGLKDISYERLDLSGLVFADLELQGVSFRDCNCTDTEFIRCNLKNAVFADAILTNTAFYELPADGLQNADFGDLKTFYTIRTDGGKVIENHGQADTWIRQQTAKRGNIIKPCDSALQLRFIFNKLVHRDGSVRRSSLFRRGMLSGKRFHSDPEAVLEAAIKRGYLNEEERYRDRIHRPEGPLYGELVSFAVEFHLTPGIKALLDDVCEEEECPHIPTVR